MSVWGGTVQVLSKQLIMYYITLPQYSGACPVPDQIWSVQQCSCIHMYKYAPSPPAFPIYAAAYDLQAASFWTGVCVHVYKWAACPFKSCSSNLC